MHGNGPDIDDDERREIDLAAIEACRSGPWSTAAEDLASEEAGRAHNDRVRARSIEPEKTKAKPAAKRQATSLRYGGTA